jgi:hypothetical protein
LDPHLASEKMGMEDESYDYYRFGSWQLKEVHPLTALPNGHNWTHGHWGVQFHLWKEN